MAIKKSAPRKKTAPKPIEPVCYTQCQAEVSNGVGFMTLGDRHEMVRCKNTPSTAVTEMKADAHGRKGHMSLCDSCLAAFRQKFPDYRKNYTFKEIDCTAGPDGHHVPVATLITATFEKGILWLELECAYCAKKGKASVAVKRVQVEVAP